MTFLDISWSALIYKAMGGNKAYNEMMLYRKKGKLPRFDNKFKKTF